MQTIRTAPEYRVSLASFSLIKGIAFLEVILVHTYSHVNWVDSKILTMLSYFIRAVHTPAMPLFLMISGFGFKPRSVNKSLAETFHTLIIPYFWVMVAYATICPILYWPVYKSWDDTMLLSVKYVLAFLLGLGDYGKVIFGIETTWNTAAWFLLASFTSLNVLNLIARIKNTAIQICIVFCCAIVGYILLQLHLGYFCIAQGLLSLGFCYIGYILKRDKLLVRMRSSLLAYCLLAVAYVSESVWGFFDIFTGTCNIFFLDYIGAACSGILFMLIGLYIAKFEWKSLDWIRQLGLYSYWILAIHAAEMEVVPWWHFLSSPLSNHQLLAFVTEITLKAIIFTTICAFLKKTSKYKYQKRVKSSAR